MITFKKLDTENKSQVNLLRKWRNENREHFIHQDIITKKMHEEWINNYKTSVNDFLFFIYSDDIPFATIGIFIQDGCGEITRVMVGNKSYERKGLMAEAFDLFLKHFGLRNYKLAVLTKNNRARSFYERNGFNYSQIAEQYLVMGKTIEGGEN